MHSPPCPEREFFFFHNKFRLFNPCNSCLLCSLVPRSIWLLIFWKLPHVLHTISNSFSLADMEGDLWSLHILWFVEPMASGLNMEEQGAHPPSLSSAPGLWSLTLIFSLVAVRYKEHSSLCWSCSASCPFFWCGLNQKLASASLPCPKMRESLPNPCQKDLLYPIRVGFWKLFCTTYPEPSVLSKLHHVPVCKD